MEKDRAGMTNMPIIPGWIDTQNQYITPGIYPEEDEIANALCLVCLMIRNIKWQDKAAPALGAAPAAAADIL